MTMSLANVLARSGVDVSVLTAKRTRQPLVAPDPGVHLKEFPTFRYYEAKTIVPFYAADLIKNKYDVVITFFADFGEGAALMLGSPFIRSRHILYLTFPPESAPHRYQAYRRFGWDRRASAILADAKYTARQAQELFGRQVDVLPSGTDPDRFKPDSQQRAALRGRLRFAASDVVLLSVGALEKRKGVWRIIEALPQICRTHDNVRFLILGEGPDRGALEQRAKEIGVADRVILAGTTADLAPFYNAADIFVMLADSEAGSIALLEAMSSGLPVVVSDCGGFDEIVTNGSGEMVSLEAEDQLVKTMVDLVENQTRRHSLGNEGRQTVVDRFSWEYLGQSLMNLCEAQMN